MMCLLNNLSGGEFILFDYMAVSESHRGHGIGSLFMLFMHESLKTSGKYVVMEVERPGAGDNQNERKRRVAFCKKSGAQILQGVLHSSRP